MIFHWTRLSGKTYMAQTPAGVILMVESGGDSPIPGSLLLIPGVEMRATPKKCSSEHDVDLVPLGQKADLPHQGPMPF